LPAKKKTEAADAVIILRLTKKEKEAITEKAKRDASLSVSEYIRRAAMGRPILSATDLATVRELRRLGGLQKHTINLYGQDPTIQQECLETIAAVRKAIEQLADKETR
jgi:hypothetical protein